MLEFEWDDAKAESNRRKHGVSFEDAAKSFLDLYAFDLQEEAHGDGEARRLSIGMAGEKMLAVVFVERGERYRIVSARRATRYEQFLFAQNRAE